MVKPFVTSMTPEEMKQQLKIDRIPDCFYEIWEEIKDSYEAHGAYILSDAYILATLEECYTLEAYRSIIVEAAALVRENPAMVLLVCLLEHWVRRGLNANFKEYEAPQGEGLAYDFLHLFPAIPSMPGSVKYLRERGVPEDIVVATMQEYDYCVEERCKNKAWGRPVFDHARLDWMKRLVVNRLIRIGRLNFELPRKRINNICVYRNTHGAICVLADGVYVHREGGILGSAGLEDSAGSFFAEVEEQEDVVTGYPVVDGCVRQEKLCLKKSEWELCLSPEDDVIAVHIPSGSGFDRDSVEASYARAREIFRNHYSDLPYKAFWCHSWLMSLQLRKVLNASSNILSFQEKYTIFPCRSRGIYVLFYVFHISKLPEDLRTLPEETSLQRGVKALCLNGEYFYEFSGFFF